MFIFSYLHHVVIYWIWWSENVWSFSYIEKFQWSFHLFHIRITNIYQRFILIYILLFVQQIQSINSDIKINK